MDYKKNFSGIGLFQAPVLTKGHRYIGLAALLGLCFVVSHLVTVFVTCMVEGFDWGINAWVLDIMGFLAAFFFMILCWRSSGRSSGEFRKENYWICLWAIITLSVRVLDSLMLFGLVKLSAIYITPEGPVLLSNIVSELVFGVAFNVTALIGSLMLLIWPQDVDDIHSGNYL